MIVRKIALNGFRNYDFETAEFSPGTNVICGPNAQGKTNLLEAVYMLSTGRSFRTRFDRELIGFGCDGADLLAEVSSHDREQTVNLRMQNGRPKRILVNAVKKNAKKRNVLKDGFCHSHDHFFFRLQKLGILRGQTVGSINGRCGIECRCNCSASCRKCRQCGKCQRDQFFLKSLFYMFSHIKISFAWIRTSYLFRSFLHYLKFII